MIAAPHQGGDPSFPPEVADVGLHGERAVGEVLVGEPLRGSGRATTQRLNRVSVAAGRSDGSDSGDFWSPSVPGPTVAVRTGWSAWPRSDRAAAPVRARGHGPRRGTVGRARATRRCRACAGRTSGADPRRPSRRRPATSVATLHRRLDVVASDVANDGRSLRAVVRTGSRGLLLPAVTFDLARRWRGEQHRGVEADPLGVVRGEQAFERAAWAVVVEEAWVTHLDPVAMGRLGAAARNRSRRIQVGGPERTRQLHRQHVARSPSGSSVRRSSAARSSQLRRRRSCVIVRGSLNTKRKSGGADSAQDCTVAGDGRP